MTILTLWTPFFGAVASVQDSLTVVIDRTPQPLKKFSEKLNETYTGDDFDYDRIEGDAENIISKFLRWFFQSIADIFGFSVSPELFAVLKFLFYGLLGVLVIYIIIKLLVGEGSSSFFTRKEVTVGGLNIQEEHIENVDLDIYIKDALAQGNYRLAIRYMFLKSLKELSLNQHIDWHYDKTNSDYYQELEGDELRANFKQAAYLYDNIWYGEFELGANGFNEAKQDFDRLQKLTTNAR